MYCVFEIFLPSLCLRGKINENKGFPPRPCLIYLARVTATSLRQSRRIRAPLIRKQRMPAFNKHLSGRWRRRSQRRGGGFRVPRDQRRSGSAGRELARFSPPGSGPRAEPRCGQGALPTSHLQLPACAHAPHGAGRDIHADLSTGGSSPPLPCSGFLAGLCRCPPGRAAFLCPARFPSSPRVAGDSSAHPRGSPLRGARRRGLGRGCAAVDRQKASISQPLLNPSSRDGRGTAPTG